MQPYNFYEAITKSDSVDLPSGVCDAIYVGGAGNVVAVMDNGLTVTFTAAAVGQVLPIRAKRVNSTNTTATAMVALYRR